MKDKNTKKLLKKFPHIFNKDFSFECNDGWFDIIFDLCRELQREVEISNCPQVVALQVKEKYGSLRFYIQGGNGVVDEIIRKYEIISSKTCEFTGGKGTLHEKNGWYKTLSTQSALLLGFNKCE